MLNLAGHLQGGNLGGCIGPPQRGLDASQRIAARATNQTAVGGDPHGVRFVRPGQAFIHNLSLGCPPLGQQPFSAAQQRFEQGRAGGSTDAGPRGEERLERLGRANAPQGGRRRLGHRSIGIGQERRQQGHGRGIPPPPK
jgi:hypothetical protein